MLRRNRTAHAPQSGGRRLTGTAASWNSDTQDQFSYIYQCLDAPGKPLLRRAHRALLGT